MRALVWVFVPVALLTACVRTDTVAERHITELSEQLGKDQAEQDRMNMRSELLSVKPEPGPKPGPSAANAKAEAPRVVAIGEEDSHESDDPNDPNARPEIRLQGAGAAAASSSRSSRRARPGREPRDEADRSKADGERPSALDPDAKKAYDAARSLVTGKQYDRALEAFASFLSTYPDHPYAENATYWRGECYFAKGEYLRAAEQFEAVLSRYNGNKAPDALLKIGMCHDHLGSPDRAKEYWDRLRHDYSRSDAVKRIPESKRERSGGAGPH